MQFSARISRWVPGEPAGASLPLGGGDNNFIYEFHPLFGSNFCPGRQLVYLPKRHHMVYLPKRHNNGPTGPMLPLFQGS